MGVEEKRILKGIREYAPAKSVGSVQREFGVEHVIKLAGNENRLGCSPEAVKALDRFIHGEDVFLYPDGQVTELRALVAEKHGVAGEELIFGNGSFELVEIIAKTYLEEGDEAILSDPSFGWYENVTRQAGAVPVKVPAKNFQTDPEAILAAVTGKTKIIWLCNPNNPTGTFIDDEGIRALAAAVPSHVLLVLDEAYIDFLEDDQTRLSASLIREYDNVIALRTFSKLYGLAGFRIGYGFANRRLIASLMKSKTPISVSAPAQTAAAASIRDEAFRRKVIDSNRAGLEFYYRSLDELGLAYVKSYANFILFDTGLDSRAVTREFLKRGVIIRGGVEYGYPTWVRVTVGREEDNELVIKILREIIQPGGIAYD